MSKTKVIKIMQEKLFWPRRWAERVLNFSGVDPAQLVYENDVVYNTSILDAHNVLADMEAI